ncbi:ABC transporter permease [Litorilinea aerophila]|nr:ABC transporter permease [Litorilinea aerophila]
MPSSKPRAHQQSSPMRRRENLLGWLLASPFLIGFTVFTAGPMLVSLFLSFADWNLLSSPQFIGLANYQEMLFADKLVGHSLKVTLYFALGSIPLHIILGLAIAMMLNTSVKGLSFFRTIYYLPAILSGVAVAMLWRWIFSPDFGLLNAGLAMVGIEGPNWLMSRQWVIPSFILMSLWGVGGSMVIYLASLQGIPTSLYEAATIDGAGWWAQTRHITLPMMSPVILFQLIIGIIQAFRFFEAAYIMTDGGPANASLFFMLYLYRQAFQYFNMGYASALAWLLFFIVLILSLLVLRSSPAWVYYETELKGR